jgi:hypothetical protein
VRPVARSLVAVAAFVLVAPVTGLLFAGGAWPVILAARFYVGLPVPESASRPILWSVGGLSGSLMGVWLGRQAWAIMGEEDGQTRRPDP